MSDDDRVSVRIRRARPSECDRLTAIAHAAKRAWSYPEGWIREWHAALTLDPEYIKTHAVHVVESDGAIAGFYALSGNGETLELDHMWIDPLFMRRGLGTRLLDHARCEARRSGATRIEIDSDPNAEVFYLERGARVIGKTPAPMEGAPERYLPRLALVVVVAD